MKGKGGGGKGDMFSNLFSTTKEKWYKQPKNQMKILFKDVAGYEKAKTEIMEFVDFLSHK
jgi:ATP-dependent Zn protease